MSKFLFSLRRLLGRSTAEDALDDEIRFHLEMSIEQKIQEGMDPAEARRRALRDFGGVEQVKERTRESWGLQLIFDTVRDVRFALRQIGRRKAYAAVIAVTLALCLGANTAAFSLLRNLILQPYTYPEIDSVFLVGIQSEREWNGMVSNVSAPQYLFVRDHQESFASIGLVDQAKDADLEAEGGVERISLDRVTPGVWSALGVAPLRGRTFTAHDLDENNERVAVLGYPLYRRMQMAGKAVIGEDILIDGEPHRVIGAMPKDFYMGFHHADLWLPRVVRGEEPIGDHSYSIVGRLGPGVTRKQAEAELAQLRRDFLEQYPDSREWFERDGIRFATLPIEELLIQPMPMISVAFFSVQAVTVIVLLIGCLNISGMIMVRSSARMREFCMRRALGAGKARLARQLLTEVIVLFLLGGLLSLGVLKLAYSGFSLINLNEIPWGRAYEVDLSILLVTFGVALLAALVTGGLPLLGILRGRLHQLIQADGRTQSGSRQRHRLHTVFVVGQVAFSLVLLVLAGVSAGNLHGVLKRNPGFERDGRMSLQVPHPSYRFGTGEEAYRNEIEPLRRRILEALRAEPGVLGAGASNRIPGSPYDTGHSGFSFPHYEFADAEHRPSALRHNISPGYLDTVGTHLLLGRDFRESDTWESEPVVIVNRKMVDRYFAGLDPIGMKLRFWDRELTIIGVVEEVRDKPYFMEETDYTLYLPLSQWQMHKSSTRFIVHVAGDPDDYRERLSALIRRLDPRASIEIETFAQTYETATFTYQLPMILTVGFALLALLLTALGLYGLISYAVAERTKEFGIRMALGAPVSSIGKMVAHWTATKVGSGMILGLVTAYLICWKIKPLVSDFNATSVPLFVASFLFVALVGVLASFFPTRRATRIEPAAALRYQ